MSINYTALKAECQTDPQALGLTADFNAGRDQAVADSLNLVRAGAPFSLFQNIAATDVQTALAPTEFAAMTATQLSQLSVLLAGGMVASSVSSVRTLATGIFSPAGSFANTRAALVAIVKRQASRAEVLFGLNTTIVHQDIAKARVS